MNRKNRSLISAGSFGLLQPRLPTEHEPAVKPARLYLGLALALAAPSLIHLPALLAGQYYFYQSYLTGTAPMSPLVRLADFLWLLTCLSGLLVVHRYLPVRPGHAGLALAGAAFALTVPLGSADFLFYFHMVRDWLATGANPYAQPFEIPNPFLTEGPASLLSPNVPYPPLWVLGCAGLRALSGDRLWLFALLLKLLLGLAHAGNYWLLVRLEGRLRGGRDGTGETAEALAPKIPPPAGEPGPAFPAAWWYLCCPLFLWEGLSLMHYELVWLFFGLLAVERLSRKRFGQAALAWALAFWIKYTAVFILPVFLPFLLARSLPARRRLGSMAGLAGLWVLAGTFATWPFQGYEPLLRGLQRQFTWLFNSWPVLLIQLFPDASRNLALVKLLLLAGAALLLLLSPRKPRLDDLSGALAWSVAGQLVFLLVASPLFFPWYALWPLLFALPLLESRYSGLFPAAWSLAALSALFYPLQYTVGHLQASFDRTFQCGYLLLSHLLPLLLLVRFLYHPPDGLEPGAPAESSAPGRTIAGSS